MRPKLSHTIEVEGDQPGARVRQVMLQAHAAAAQHVGLLENALDLVHTLATEISGGGAVYPAGVRDMSLRLAQDTSQRARTLALIMSNAQPRTTCG